MASRLVLLRKLLAGLLGACLFPCAVPARAAQKWIRVSTPHFEMYTTNSEKQAVRALQTFEEALYFFSESSPAKVAPEGRVRVIAFSSEKEYKPYRLNGGSFAYYLRGRERDYIVMQDVEPEHAQAAIHEYTHLFVEHLKLQFPIWLNEGIAEVYSSLEPRGNQALVGRPLEGRELTLLTQRWVDWNVLFAVDQNSPYYNESDKMSVFYAQSWALTHMLMLGDGYRQWFTKFLVAVASGKPAPEALNAVYGKSVKDIDKDLHSYLNRSTVTASVFNVKLEKAALEPEVEPLQPFDTDLALADILAARPGTAEEARTRLLALEKEHPESADVEESLGYLAWEKGDLALTRTHFGMAVQRGSKDPDMILSYAQMMRAAGAPASEAVPLLMQVTALKPNDDEARLELGLAALDNKQYGFALSTLSAMKTVKPENAYRFYIALAYCRMNLGDEAGAKQLAQKALSLSKDPTEGLQAENLLAYLSRNDRPKVQTPEPAEQTNTRLHPTLLQREPGLREPDLPAVKGKTKSLECVNHALRLHVQSGAREMIFSIPDPKLIIVRNAKDNAVEWSCGPLPRGT